MSSFGERYFDGAIKGTKKCFLSNHLSGSIGKINIISYYTSNDLMNKMRCIVKNNCDFY